MWGPESSKDPGNYTRETTNPHGGLACLRTHYPAGSAGYLVSDPAHAIRPTAGMRYTVTFWARADRPGTASFGFTSYKTISPFVDAPSPGNYDLKVGTDWRRYEFTIREARDFFADSCRYLLLTFHAALSNAEEGTLYVDDVSATETASHEPYPLLNLDTIRHDPLPHRLTPGPSLEFTVDARRHERPATTMAGGVSFHRVAGWTGQPYDRAGRDTLDPRLEQAIKEIRLPMSRFYGVGAEQFPLEASIDRIVSLCRKFGVAQQNVVLELEDELADRALPTETWARAVRYCRVKHYGFRNWEVANEPYSSLWHLSYAPTGQAFPTPEAYVAHLKAVSEAIHHEQPDARVGVNVTTFNTAWGNAVLRETAGSYDFVVPHYYSWASVSRESFEDLVLTANYRMLDQALRVNALIRAYNPHRHIVQLDTEWGNISEGPKGEVADDVPRNANVIGLVHRAVRLIYYAREGMLEGASGWQMLNNVNSPGFGILSQQSPDKRFLLYWLYYYFNRHVGAWVNPISGSAPYQSGAGKIQDGLAPVAPGPLTPVLATSRADGKELFLVVANGSWDRSVPLRARLRGFSAGRAVAVVLSQPDMDAPPLLQRKEDGVHSLDVRLSNDALTATLPPHSVSFFTLTARPLVRSDSVQLPHSAAST